MRGRVVETAVLVVAIGLLTLLAIASSSGPVSTHSTFDTGPNGYRALYDVLLAENVPVSRLQAPLGTLDPRVRVLAVASAVSTFRGLQMPIAYDSADVKRLASFTKSGGTVIAFGRIVGMKPSAHVHFLDADSYTNLALSRHPANALEVYRAVAGKGLVAFDERAQGYDSTQSLWSVLPSAVRVAAILAAIAVVLALIDANVRFAPPIARDPPADRDSSDYVRSMAALLRRANAGQPAIERFARAFPNSQELRDLSAITRPSGATVLRAATLYSNLRKDRA
jgi:hypothetical protein